MRRPAARLGSGGGAADQRRPLLQRLLAAIIPIAEDHGASGAPWAHQPRAARAAGAFGSGQLGQSHLWGGTSACKQFRKGPRHATKQRCGAGGQVWAQQKCCAPFHAVAGTIRSACIRDAKQSLFPNASEPAAQRATQPEDTIVGTRWGPQPGLQHAGMTQAALRLLLQAAAAPAAELAGGGGGGGGDGGSTLVHLYSTAQSSDVGTGKRF